MNRSAREAFTLVEVMIALLIGGALLLSSRELFNEMGTEAHLLIVRATADDSVAESEQLLRTIVNRADLSVPGDGFEGDPDHAKFSSWCDSANGWPEHCAVLLQIIHVNDSSTLLARSPVFATRAVTRKAGEGRLLYLSGVGEGGVWTQRWGTSSIAPIAIGVALGSDTLVVPIGVRQ